MSGGPEELDGLTRHDQRALRALLIRATAASRSAAAGGELDQLTDGAPVDALPAAAALHRISGTVDRGLGGVRGVPCSVRAELTAQRGRSSLRHLIVVGALGQIRSAFDDAGLSWVAMKGPVVAALLYPDVGDRSYADLDLLVDRRDFPHAVRLLEGLGYEHSVHDWALAEAMLAGQVGLTSPIVHVDLHWHLHYSREDRRPFAIDPGAMVERARRVTVSSLIVPTFDAVDTLLTLGFHAARSDGHRLVWLKDVERAVVVDQPDLDELVRRCRAYRCAPPVGLILGRARSLLGADIPEETIRALTPPALRAADRLMCTITHPIQFDEHETITRLFTRSVRSSALTSVLAVPERGARWLQRTLRPTRWNESDDADEKVSYLQAVATSSES